MCNIVEEYTGKRNAEVAAASRLEGKLEGKFEANIDNIKTLMQTLHFSAKEAMDALRVDETKRSQYMALL